VIVLGLAVFLVQSRIRKEWPFAPASREAAQ